MSKIYTLISIIVAIILCFATLFTNINPLIFVIILEGYNICYILFIYTCKTNRNTVRRLLMLSMLIFAIMAFGLCLFNIKPIIGEILILFGLFFKLGVVPFHSWLPDVYEYSSFNTVAVTEVFKIVFITVFVCILPVMNYHSIFIIHIMGYISLLIGATLALRERNIKRWLAYLGIGHIGIMMCIINNNCANNIVPIVGLKYIATYTSCSVIFCIIKNNVIKVLTIFGMIGLPPFHTFFAKIDLIEVLLKGNNIYNLFVIIVYFVFELISAIYWINFYLTSKDKNSRTKLRE